MDSNEKVKELARILRAFMGDMYWSGMLPENKYHTILDELQPIEEGDDEQGTGD